MADCLDFVYDQEHIDDPAAEVQFGGVSVDGTVHVGQSVGNGHYYSLTDYVTVTEIHDPSANAAWGTPVVDSSDKVWWVETPDFSTYNLKRMELDGSSATTVAAITGLPAFAFEVPTIRYDPVADRFWFLFFASGSRGLWTLTKAGVATQRYATTDQPGWGAVVADDGAAWARFNNSGTDDETIVRVDGSTFAATTIAGQIFTSRFQVAFPAGTGGGVIARDGTVTRLYIPGITNDPADCDVNDAGQPAQYSAFGQSYATPDFSTTYYSVGNGCPFWSLIWARTNLVDVPPLRIGFRDDARSVAGARQNHGATSIQESVRTRQGSGYL